MKWSVFIGLSNEMINDLEWVVVRGKGREARGKRVNVGEWHLIGEWLVARGKGRVCPRENGECGVTSDWGGGGMKDAEYHELHISNVRAAMEEKVVTEE